MAIQPSGNPVTFLDLQSEYGGSTPISINEYYRGGTYVTDNNYDQSIPTSGQISMSQFYSTRQVLPPQLAPSPNPASGFGSANASSGTVTSSTISLVPSDGDGTYTYTATLVSAGGATSPACTFTGNTCKISGTISGVPINGQGFATVTYHIVCHSGGVDSTTYTVSANLEWDHDNGL